MTKLSNNTRFSQIASAFASFGAAFDLARAVENRTMPSRRSLKTLGIEEATFRRITFGS